MTIAIRKTILYINNVHLKTIHGSIKEDRIEHRDDFLKLCDHPEIDDENKIGLLSYTLKGNKFSRYRKVVRDVMNWRELYETFTKFFLTEAHHERNSFVWSK